MLLERLSIENYGVYAEKSEFDLSSTTEKPIVLIGGLNGAGKTTIFESLMTALYGKTYLGRRTTKKEYTEFIAEKLHRHDGRRANHASVEVAFRFYHNGCDDGYSVRRSWEADGVSVQESLLIKKNGETMGDVDESQWQSFIEGLIPLGIARLFFFDGEKIVRMIEWDSHDSDEIKSSLDMLLGAELINRLYSDLNLYVMRHSGGNGGADTAVQKRYEEMRREKDAVADDIELLRAEHEKKGAEIDDMAANVGARESKIAGVGGGYADRRGTLLTKRAVLEEKIRHQRKAIQEELGEDAPLRLVGPMLNEIKGQIEKDMSIASQKASAGLIRDKVGRLKEDMSSGEFWPNGMDTTLISEKILRRLDSMIEEPKSDVFFDIAPSEATWMLQKIAKASDGPTLLLEKIGEYAKTVASLEAVESDLAKIPKDDEIGPRISEINALHREIGILISETAHIDQQISSNEAYQKILKNKLKGMIDSMHKSSKARTGTKLAMKMQEVLDTYSANLKERKILELESNLLDAVRLLLHKRHIHRIAIDRQTFEIRAYENGDDAHPGALKSMGEKQIVGTALLWAIAKTSGRALPFIIDTPLGRLDGKHLSNLIDRFYPFASHQTILLSTDREIGHREYGMLSKYTSRSYKITCNENKSVTTVSAGYFGEEGKEIVQA